jgi:hypothetical protein
MQRNHLIRLFNFGPECVPEDLDGLKKFHRSIVGHLAERAGNFHATWSMAADCAKEIDLLLDLEQDVAVRASKISARDLRDVQAKLAIWQEVSDREDEPDEGIAAAIVRSVKRDIDRLVSRSGAIGRVARR